MIVDAEGIIIKRIPYSDHSSVVHIYTDRNGLSAFLVQGLGKPKSKRNAYFQCGQILNLSYYEKELTGLRKLKEVHLHPENPVMLNFAAQQLVFFYTELLSLCVVEHDSDVRLFQFIKQSITELPQLPTLKYQAVKFVLHLSDFLGYRISAKSHFSNLLDWEHQIEALIHNKPVEISKEDRRMLLKHVIHELQMEVFPQKNLKSLDIIESLFYEA